MTAGYVRGRRALTNLVVFSSAVVIVATTISHAAAQECTAGNTRWIRQFGTAASDDSWGVAVDAAANTYVVGNTAGALGGQTSAGGIDAFVRKHDSAGNEVWTRQFGTTGDDFAWDVTVDGIGNVYIAASVANASIGRHAVLRKYDATGSELWTREFGGLVADAMGVAVDAAGYVYVTGTVFGAPFGQISAGTYDAFLRKYDSTGNHVWTRQFGTPGVDSGRNVGLDAAGYVYVAGYVDGALPGQISAGGTDAFVRQYSSAGTEMWTRQFGTSGDDWPSGLAVEAAGNAYVTGGVAGALLGQTWFGGLVDVFLRKYDGAGNELWTRQFGTPLNCLGCFGFDFAYGVAVDDVGNAYVTGTVGGALPHQTFRGGGDAFVRMYDPAGAEVFTKQLGTPVSDDGRDVAVDGGSLYLAGVTFGVLEGQNPGFNWDAFATRLFLRDVEPPSLTVVLSANTLWPPDHRMVEVSASISVDDACDSSPIVSLVSVTSNEPDDGIGDGDTVNDIQIVDPYRFLLRAERSGSGMGRVYTVTYVATDSAGNTSGSVSASVTVPR